MSPVPNHHPTNGLSPKVAKIARTLDWWERVLAVAVVPFALWFVPKAFEWVGTVEDRLHHQSAEITALQVEDAASRKMRADLLMLLEKVREQQVEMLQRLSRIEALVTKGD